MPVRHVMHEHGLTSLPLPPSLSWRHQPTTHSSSRSTSSALVPDTLAPRRASSAFSSAT